MGVTQHISRNLISVIITLRRKPLSYTCNKKYWLASYSLHIVFHRGGSKPEVVVGNGSRCTGGVISTGMIAWVSPSRFLPSEISRTTLPVRLRHAGKRRDLAEPETVRIHRETTSCTPGNIRKLPFYGWAVEDDVDQHHTNQRGRVAYGSTHEVRTLDNREFWLLQAPPVPFLYFPPTPWRAYAFNRTSSPVGLWRPLWTKNRRLAASSVYY